MGINPLASQTTAQLQPGDLLTEVEAAAILGIEVSTLRNWRSLRKYLPFRKIGKRMVRYHRADLAAFVAGDDRKAAA